MEFWSGVHKGPCCSCLGWSCLVCEVLPDWHGAGLSLCDTEQKMDEAAFAVDASIAELLQAEGEAARAAKKRRVKRTAANPENLPNRQMALAIDNALQSARLSLKQFVPETLLKPLQQHERRYLVELPAAWAIEGVAAWRSAIHDQRSGSTRVELPRRAGVPLVRPALHKCLDEGSIGLVMTHFLDCCVQLRGSSMGDPFHRWFNDMKGALQDTGLWSLVCERCILLNLSSAPWGNHGFFGQLVGAATEYFIVRDHHCELFLGLYMELWLLVCWSCRHRLVTSGYVSYATWEGVISSCDFGCA